MLIVPVILMGCKKSSGDEPETVKLAVTPNSIISPSAGADYSLTLIAPDAWTASCADSWVKVNPTSGNAGTMEVGVKIAADKTSTEASSKIVFKSGDQTVEVPVKRLAKDPARLMIVSDKEIQTPKEGGTYSIQVESNIKWQISSDASWAKIDGEAMKRNNATITVNVDEATKPEETVATITVSPADGSGVEKQTVTITRGSSDATSLVVSPKLLKNTYIGGSHTVQVTTTAKEWRVVEKPWDADWLTITNGSGSGNGSFGVTVQEATSSVTRSAILTVTEVRSDSYTPVTAQVVVARSGKPDAELSVDPTSIYAPAEGGTFTVTIKCNYAWKASLSGTSIFSTSITQGNGNATMVVTVKPATSDKEATGKITIMSTYGGLKEVINIHRDPLVVSMLEVSPNKIDAPCEGKEYTVNVTCNTDWQVSSSNTKVATVSPASGNKNGSFKVTVSPALDYESSSARITVSTKDGSVTQQVMVTRAAKEKSHYLMYPFTIGMFESKVYFSPGNLQYQATSNTWRFAEQQYEFVGDAIIGNVYIGEEKCDNTKISTTYSGWIDLFGWGTGANPTLHTNDGSNYTAFTDWGTNTIKYYDKTSPANSWRTLEKDHWVYLLTKRYNAEKLHGNATVNGVTGLVLLPDNWQFSSYLPFTGGVTAYDVNVITLSKWQQMEQMGAVFLPAAAERQETQLKFKGGGCYWSSVETSNTAYAYYLSCSSDRIGPQDSGFRYEGKSVRLVQDIK